MSDWTKEKSTFPQIAIIKKMINILRHFLLMAYSYVIKKRQGKSLAFDCVTMTRQLQQSLTVYTQVCIWTNNRVMLQKTMKESWSSILNRSTNKIYVNRQGTVISYIHEVQTILPLEQPDSWLQGQKQWRQYFRHRQFEFWSSTWATFWWQL